MAFTSVEPHYSICRCSNLPSFKDPETYLFNFSCVQDEDTSLHQTFLDITLVSDEFFIMCKNGRLYKLSNLEDVLLSQSVLEASTKSVGNETFLNATLERVTNSKYSQQLNAFCYLETWEGPMIILAGDEYLYFQNEEQICKVKYPAKMEPIKKILNLEEYVLVFLIS